MSCRLFNSFFNNFSARRFRKNFFITSTNDIQARSPKPFIELPNSLSFTSFLILWWMNLHDFHYIKWNSCFHLGCLSLEFFYNYEKRSQCSWFPSVVKGQKSWDKFMNIDLNISLFLKCITDKVFRLIWTLAIKWNNLVQLFETFWLKPTFPL